MAAELFSQAIAALHSSSHELGDQPNHHRGFAEAVRRLEKWQAIRGEGVAATAGSPPRAATTADPAAVPRTTALPGTDPHLPPPGPLAGWGGRPGFMDAPRPRNGRAYTSEEIGEIVLPPGHGGVCNMEGLDIEKATALLMGMPVHGPGSPASWGLVSLPAPARAPAVADDPPPPPEPRPPLPDGVVGRDGVPQLWDALRVYGEAFPEPPVSLEGMGKLASVTGGPLAGHDVGLCAVAGEWAACEMSAHEGGYIVAVERKHLRPWQEVALVRGDSTSVPLHPGEEPWDFLKRLPAQAASQRCPEGGQD
jgi:hypothetical protein